MGGARLTAQMSGFSPMAEPAIPVADMGTPVASTKMSDFSPRPGPATTSPAPGGHVATQRLQKHRLGRCNACRKEKRLTARGRCGNCYSKFIQGLRITNGLCKRCGRNPVDSLFPARPCQSCLGRGKHCKRAHG